MNLITRTIDPADIVFPSEEATPASKPSAAAPLEMEAIEHSVWQMLAHCGVTN